MAKPREIEFRVWFPELGRMELIDLEGQVHDTTEFYIAMRDGIIMQFTGLYGNGKMIFEGDIVRWRDGDSVVMWEDRTASFRLVPVYFYDGQSCSLSLSKKFIDMEDYEVVGDIYRNSELVNYWKPSKKVAPNITSEAVFVEGVGEVDVNTTHLIAQSAKTVPKELTKLISLYAPLAIEIPKELVCLTTLYAPNAAVIPKELVNLVWLSAKSATEIPIELVNLTELYAPNAIVIPYLKYNNVRAPNARRI